VNPFRGLEFFDSEHAPLFFGRAKVIENVLEVLRQQAAERRPFVLVLGPGASGKTSLVRAGILPALTQTGTFEPDRPWRVVFTRPSGGRTGDPVDALAASLLQGLALPEFPDAANGNGWQELAAELRETPEDAALRLRETLQFLGAQAPNGKPGGHDSEAPPAGPRQSVDLLGQTKPAASKVRVALIVDQLEELFQVPSELQRKYIAALGALVKWRTAFVIAALRSDCSAAFQQCCNPKDIAVRDLSEFSARDLNIGEVLAGRFDLPAPNTREIGEMIRSPADATGLRFEHDPVTGQSLDDALLEAATGVGEPLPLLEHLLSQLYQKQLQRNDGLLSWSDYRELGGLEGALTNHAEGVFSAVDTDAQAALQPIIRQLASTGPGEEAALARRTVLHRDLTSTPEFNEDQKAGAQRLIDRFIREGLFRIETAPDADSLVSVSQCLLRNWPRARQLLDESQGLLRSRDRLEPDFKHWLSGGRKSTDLLSTRSGVRDAKTLLKSFRTSLSDTQVDYLQKSLTGQNRRRRFRRAVLAIVAALIIPAAVLGVQWLSATIEQRKGEPRLKELSRKNSEPPDNSHDALQSRVNDAEARAQRIQTTMQLVAGERDALQNQLKGAEANAQQARKDAELASGQRDALQNQLNDTQARAQRAQKDAGLASSQRDALQGQLNDAQAKALQAKKDAALASSQRDALQAQLNDIQAKAQQAKKDAGPGFNQRDALQGQLNDAQARAQQAQKDAALASGQRDALQAQLNDTQAKAQQAEKAAALASSQRDALQGQLTQLRQNKVELQADQRDALQAQLNDADDKVQHAREDAELASSQRDALQAQLNDAQARAQQAQRDAGLASSQRDALQTQLSDTQARAQQARKDAELASSQRDALQAQLSDTQARAQQARKDAELASSQRGALQAQLSDTQAKAQQARKDAELASSQRGALQA
jgi:chromosome segregation ATPase